jgi:hypothetical protein
MKHSEIIASAIEQDRQPNSAPTLAVIGEPGC